MERVNKLNTTLVQNAKRKYHRKFDINNGSEFSLSAQVKDVSSSWITATALEIPKLGLKYSEAMGKANDLEKLINVFAHTSPMFCQRPFLLMF